jgi:hypothetical protein
MASELTNCPMGRFFFSEYSSLYSRNPAPNILAR